MDDAPAVIPADASFVAHLWLTDFRCIPTLDLTLTPGVTVVHGDNGQGKTSLLEAVGWPARASSLRNVSDAAVVRAGCETAIVRSEIVCGDRHQTFEAEIKASGRNRMRVNAQPVQRIRDLYGLLRITVFAPDDLQMVKAGPALRRAYLDDLLAALSPRYGAALSDYERVVKQRNALLKQIRADRSALATLPAFDEQLVTAATEIVRGRLQLVERLGPPLVEHYRALGEGSSVDVDVQFEWTDTSIDTADLDAIAPALRCALDARRTQEIDRQLTLVGPHRDDLVIRINGLDARTQASQGEQRSMALAMRLAGHAVVTDLTGAAPVLLLDDVFSELDPRRTAALIEVLPSGQTLVSTASDIPSTIDIDRVLEVEAGTVRER